jgi:nucleotide-binding universal stress UspA family protein
MPYRNVVVGTDGSESAEGAVRHAAELAQAFGSRLTVVTVFQRHPDENTRLQAEVPDDIRWMLTDAAQAEEKAKHGRALAKELGLADVKVRIGDGDPAEQLIEAAEDTGADLIVVGSKGMTGAKRFLIGSVPNRVSHHAPCDVIIVHTV